MIGSHSRGGMDGFCGTAPKAAPRATPGLTKSTPHLIEVFHVVQNLQPAELDPRIGPPLATALNAI